MLKPVTSFANPTIKRLRSLHDKKGRRAEGLFLAEGLRVVAEAVAAGWAPRALLLTADAAVHPLGRSAARMCLETGGEALEVPRELLAKVCAKDNPAGAAAAFAIPDTSLTRVDVRSSPVWIAAEKLKDPGNLGTMLRTADATGAGGLILVDQSCDPWSVEAVRASMGAVFTRAVAQAGWDEFRRWASGAQLVGAVVGADTIDYQAVRYAAPTVLLMGNEQSGLPGAYAAACDERVTIPMAGKADSLNVAVAAAVLLYEVVNQRRRADPPDRHQPS
ncbi:MAG: RNA methyltransferase [Sphingomonadaceae bacterium]|nr:RNA methyltransferase [Sphingomonadaceae bacterium]